MMTILNLARYLASICSLLIVTGCSFDSSSDAVPSNSLRLTLSTAGKLPTNVSLAGIGMTLSLPTGVAPALDQAGMVDTSQLVSASGVAVPGGLTSAAVSLEAAAGKPARLSLVMASKAASGFGLGETARITLNGSPAGGSANVAVTEFVATDLSGRPVPGVTVALLPAQM